MKKNESKKLKLKVETLARLEGADVRRAIVGGSCQLGCASEYCNLHFITDDCC